MIAYLMKKLMYRYKNASFGHRRVYVDGLSGGIIKVVKVRDTQWKWSRWAKNKRSKKLYHIWKNGEKPDQNAVIVCSGNDYMWKQSMDQTNRISLSGVLLDEMSWNWKYRCRRVKKYFSLSKTKSQGRKIRDENGYKLRWSAGLRRKEKIKNNTKEEEIRKSDHCRKNGRSCGFKVKQTLHSEQLETK